MGPDANAPPKSSAKFNELLSIDIDRLVGVLAELKSAQTGV